MDLNLNEEQRLIVDSAAEFLAAHSASELVYALASALPNRHGVVSLLGGYALSRALDRNCLAKVP